VTDEASVSPGGQIFQEFVKDALAHEFERRKNLEGRGAVLLTSSGTMVTIILGLTVLITGKDFVFVSRCAVVLLCIALVAFVLSATAAIIVQAWAFKYDLVDQDDLDKLVENEYWDSTANIAARDTVDLHVRTIRSLRKGSRIKSSFLITSLVIQLIAIVLLSTAIGDELVRRIQAG
jgi:hypothetical protein